MPAGAPRITITEPADGAQVGNASVTLRGTAEGTLAEILVTTVRDAMAVASLANAWSATLALKPGWNRILAQVRDAQGRIAAAERRVRYVPAGALAVTDTRESSTAERWEPYVIRFRFANSAATHLQLP